MWTAEISAIILEDKDPETWMGPTLSFPCKEGAQATATLSGIGATSQVSGQHVVLPCCYLPRKVNFSCPLSSSINEKNPHLVGPGNSWSTLLFRGSFLILKIILSRQGKEDDLSHFPNKKIYPSASAYLSSSLTLTAYSLVVFVILPCVGVPTFGDFQIWLSWPESHLPLCLLSCIHPPASHFLQPAPWTPCNEFHHSVAGLLWLLWINIC